MEKREQAGEQTARRDSSLTTCMGKRISYYLKKYVEPQERGFGLFCFKR
jgi:hypothetical protein